MDIELLLVKTIQQKAIFERLLQLYEYEFSDITQLHPTEDGYFINEELERNIKAHLCDCYLLKFEGKWAGLAVINLKSYLNDDPEIRDVGEFFVMKLYRRRRVGRKMAEALFDLYPGRWEIRQLPNAAESHAFWIRVVDHYTHHHFKDKLLDHPRWRGYIQKINTNDHIPLIV